MKKQLSVVVLSTLVATGGLVWFEARDQKEVVKTMVVVVHRPIQSAGAAMPAAVVAVPVPVSPAPIQRDPAVAAVSVADGPSKHVAQPGETVTSLATDLMGKDSKNNRDAIIDANASLKADPDKLVAGKSYKIPPAGTVAAAPVAPVVIAPVSGTSDHNETAHAAPARELKYTAAPGDTVSTMASAFLGSDDQAHQDAIINANKSLKADPDKVVAGKVYKIPAPDGLSASADASATPGGQTVARPTTQPDADQIVTAGSPRSLRYTAREGDTVTTLAIALLGSDSEESRNAIINDNPSLKANPDRVVAGQTYWIPAPKAAGQNP